ncbi:MAG: aKG-HExxH-type peptide beta-hydroxylase [Saprospiraceae bacterium]
MNLTDTVINYLSSPYPIWECEVTESLVQNKWNELRKEKQLDINDYSTARCIANSSISNGTKIPLSGISSDEIIYLESPSFDQLGDFYQEHGLAPLFEPEFKSNQIITKLNKAMAVLALVKPAHSCIAKLVRSVQVLKQEDAEIDVSYSHPQIPFSIFVSVCEDDSDIFNLRVAESILHEAMHLKLTLIEGIVPLVKPFTGNLYYSPWRDEGRPAQGVLHGLFVFKSILDFYCQIAPNIGFNKVGDYLEFRKFQIINELNELKDFFVCQDLTQDGANLSKNLLP